MQNEIGIQPGSITDAGANIKKYIGCKIIAAEPMDYETWARSQNKWQEKQETMGEGYKVIYPDNYISWSPKKVFEEAYR